MSKTNPEFVCYDPAQYPLQEVAELVVHSNLWADYRRKLIKDFDAAVRHPITIDSVQKWVHSFDRISRTPEDNPLFSAFVAVKDDRPVGFVATGHDVYDARKKTGEIQSLSVDYHHWGQGLGTRLLTIAEMQLEAAGCQRVTLCVEQGNRAAIKLYSKNGWQKVEGVYHSMPINGRRAAFLEFEKNF